MQGKQRKKFLPFFFGIRHASNHMINDTLQSSIRGDNFACSGSDTYNRTDIMSLKLRCRLADCFYDRIIGRHAAIVVLFPGHIDGGKVQRRGRRRSAGLANGEVRDFIAEWYVATYTLRTSQIFDGCADKTARWQHGLGS